MSLGLSAELLARFQFAFTVSFHFIFPAFSIGLASFMAVLNALWLWKRDVAFLRLFDYWKTIFAVTFGMGVVSGIVMSYQFGTNWATFSDKAGPVIGPLMGYEVLTAFFLEAGFLGIALFGRKRVGDGLHMFAVAMVAFGTLVSATWILSANSWMQTPAGFAIDPDTGHFYAVDWIEVIFNPSFPSRLAHMLLAAYTTTAAVILAAGAWQLLKGRSSEPTRWQIRMAAGTLAVVMPVQIMAGHWSGEVAHEHQPAKVAAMEGWCTSETVQGTVLIAWPDGSDCGHSGITIPGTSPYLFPGLEEDEILKGIDAWPASEQPPMWPVFWAFRIMVGCGLAMLAMGLWGSFLWWRGRIDTPGLFHMAAVPAGGLGFLAVITGWIVAEVGRQPYTVYGHLRTADSLSPISAEQVATSLLVFMIVYAIIFTAGVVYMARIATRGFDDKPAGGPEEERRAPGTPMAAVDEPAETAEDIVAAD